MKLIADKLDPDLAPYDGGCWVQCWMRVPEENIE